MKKKIVAIFVGLLFLLLSLLSYAISASGKQNTAYSPIAPSDTISENQILVYDNKVLLMVQNAQWASYTNTKSMSPVLDYGANGIEIVPKSKEELHIGDIVAYETKWNKIPVVHRIVDIKEDELGTYYVLKGDNNKDVDPVKVRFEQIRYKVIAIVY